MMAAVGVVVLAVAMVDGMVVVVAAFHHSLMAVAMAMIEKLVAMDDNDDEKVA